jgi:rhodanese-related sulfurtransferase
MFETFKRMFSGRTVPSITVKELFQVMKNPEGAQFIDVRRGDEWNTGNIDGFKHIPLLELKKHAGFYSQYPKIYFICRTGARSYDACIIMQDAGYQGAVNVEGGLVAWDKAHLPLRKQTQ